MDTKISAVFTAAATATAWQNLSFGRTTTVNHDGYTWTVLLPAGIDPAQAEITYREGYGGVEPVGAIATWGQTFGIVEAAMSATRIH